MAAGFLTGTNEGAATAPVSARQPGGGAGASSSQLQYGNPTTPTSSGSQPSTANPNAANNDALDTLVNMRVQAATTPTQQAPLDWATKLGSTAAGILNPDVSAMPSLTSSITPFQYYMMGANNVAPYNGPQGGNLAQWIQQAEQATGVGGDWTNALNTIIQHESGGNPTAINLWDSNAKAGHPSQGLMQTIPGTFNQFVPANMRGWGITNPVANIAAGIEYILSRYGGYNNVPGIASLARGGSYVGY